MGFENLTDVHSTRDSQWVKYDVYRGSVFEEWHVFNWQNLGDNTLVAVTASEFVTLFNLALLSDVDAHQFGDTRWQFVAFVHVKDANGDDLAGLTVGYLQRSIANLASLLAKDRAQ